MDEINKLLNPDNTVMLNRPLAHALGTNAAIVYSALIAKQVYYSERGMLDAEGYFYSAIADLEESTGLSKRKQKNAIDTLVISGLINCKKRGMPARRCFRICEDIEIIGNFLECGKSVMSELKPCQNVPTSESENAQQVGAKCTDKSEQNAPPIIYNLKKKSKDNNPNQSILSDGIDMMDNSSKVNSSEERDKYLEIIKENIEYEYQTEKEKYDELVEIMVDVICSTSKTIRVNGEKVPHEVVKSRFLKLNSDHIDYVLTAMENNTSEIRSIRSYLITALYNGPTTMNSYYKAWVNHDMYGNPRKS